MARYNGKGHELRRRPMAPGASDRQAKIDTTALLSARLVEYMTDSKSYIPEVMDAIVSDGPERIMGALLCMMNVAVQYITVSGSQPQHLQECVDYLAAQLNIGEG